MVGPQEGIKFHLRYEIMYLYVILFFYTWKFWVSSFSSFRGLRVLGSLGLRFRGLRFRDTLID